MCPSRRLSVCVVVLVCRSVHYVVFPVLTPRVCAAVQRMECQSGFNDGGNRQRKRALA